MYSLSLSFFFFQISLCDAEQPWLATKRKWGEMDIRPLEYASFFYELQALFDVLFFSLQINHFISKCTAAE